METVKKDFVLRTLGVLIILSAATAVSGCLMNSVHRIYHRSNIGPRDAVVVIGVGLDARWPYPKLSFALDEYSMEEHKSTGGCFFYNRIDIQLPPDQASVKYLVYTVPAGVYVWSAFNGAPSPKRSAFIASAGKAVYIGDYIFNYARVVDVRSNLEAAQLATQSVLSTNEPLVTADSPSSAIHGTVFLCTP